MMRGPLDDNVIDFVIEQHMERASTYEAEGRLVDRAGGGRRRPGRLLRDL